MPAVPVNWRLDPAQEAMLEQAAREQGVSPYFVREAMEIELDYAQRGSMSGVLGALDAAFDRELDREGPIPAPATLRLSAEERGRMMALKRRTGIATWNVLARWALCRSLAEPAPPPAADLRADGPEMSWQTFGGPQAGVYWALVLERARRDRLHPWSAEALYRQLRLHIFRGLGYLVAEARSISELVAVAAKVGDGGLVRAFMAAAAPAPRAQRRETARAGRFRRRGRAGGRRWRSRGGAGRRFEAISNTAHPSPPPPAPAAPAPAPAPAPAAPAPAPAPAPATRPAAASEGRDPHDTHTVDLKDLIAEAAAVQVRAAWDLLRPSAGRKPVLQPEQYLAIHAELVAAGHVASDGAVAEAASRRLASELGGRTVQRLAVLRAREAAERRIAALKAELGDALVDAGLRALRWRL